MRSGTFIAAKEKTTKHIMDQAAQKQKELDQHLKGLEEVAGKKAPETTKSKAKKFKFFS